jgi:hypothetical protein
MVPGGKPVTAVPGLTPRLPSTTVAPVLVAVEPAKTAKLCAEPSDGAAGPAKAIGRAIPTEATSATATRMIGTIN